MKTIDKLSDVAIRAAKPTERPTRIADGGGLYLEISPAGGKLSPQGSCETGK
jgi:hypothetical protein